MRDFHKAGLGLAAGIALTVCPVATALADAPCNCGEQKERQGDTASPPEQIAPSEEQGSEGAGAFQLGPLTGPGGPGWSPIIISVQGNASLSIGMPKGPAFGAGLGGQGGFGIEPLPGADIGEWSPSVGIGQRTFGNIGR
jgi:hypothetical protein